MNSFDWNTWYTEYETSSSLQDRLRLVQREIVAALNEAPRGPIQIVSLCAGDGRDVIGALRDHSRRDDVSAWLLDTHAESLERGKAAAAQAGLEQRISFFNAEAGLAASYAGIVPAEIVILSGFLGHLRHEGAAKLIENLPMLCKPGAFVIWSRHLVLHDGRDQVPAIRHLLRRWNFEELSLQTTSAAGFAVGRARFCGEAQPLDSSRVLFEFIGLDRLLPEELPASDISLEQFFKNRAAVPESATAIALSCEAEQSIPSRFGRIVTSHGSRVAIQADAGRLTYAELDALSSRVAGALLEYSRANGERVAIMMRQDAPLIATILGVLKAGKVVVVLNATDPPARLKEILQDAEPAAILTDALNRETAHQIAQDRASIFCYGDCSSHPLQAIECRAAPGDLAWLVYTSGSTGKPKGVMQTHRNIIHNALRLARGMELQPTDRVALLASPSGGQGISTLWCPLLNGAALCPYPTTERGIAALPDWLSETAITIYVSSASIFRQLVGTMAPNQRISEVRLVRFGSEEANANDFAAWRHHFSEKCVLLNTLSSSETGNITQQRFAHGDQIHERSLSIGQPVDGTEVLLVNHDGDFVRDGDSGEMIVRSRYLSPGYWRNEAMTARSFSVEPGNGEVKIFRTGDFARRLPDGTLMFVGRKNDRVKIHGYRVEIAEIESALNAQPEVEATVVRAHSTSQNDLQLVTYIVLRQGQKCSEEDLRSRLRAILPGYMVPGRFVFLSHFPLTPHGKIDRQALAPPALKRRARARPLPPRDVIERHLVKIWQSVLRISPIGRRDDFFELGGTSLHSIEVLAAIQEMFNVALPPATLIEHSTIENLAPLLSDRAIIPSSRPLVVLREGNGERPLFLVHSGQGDVVTYGLLARLLKERPVYGLQAPGVHGESWPLMDVHAMAMRYLPEILTKDSTGPYLLAATCMGGMVAFEMACRLMRMGRNVGLLALVDVPTSPHAGRRSQWHEALIDPVRDALRICRWSFARIGGLKIKAHDLPEYRRFVANMTGRARRRYRPGFFPGTITLILTADTKYAVGDTRQLITRNASAARTFWIPASRSGLFVRPAVEELARVLQDRLDEAEGVVSAEKEAAVSALSTIVE